MIVGGMSGLFPLMKLNTGWESYFMNGAGQVFSTKTNTVPRRLNGSNTTSGHYYTLSPSSFGYSTTTERADKLYLIAKKHSDFKKETALTTDTVIHDSPFNKLKGGYVPSGDRDHASTVQTGIKSRGYVIARIEGEALVFGSKPKIHTTLKSVKSEIERLANKTPGLQLIYLKIEGAVRAASLVWG